MQDPVPDLMKFMTRPLYGIILRAVAFCLVVVGLVAAGLEAHWAGFTPVVWLLLALAAILGVICNAVAQVAVRTRAAASVENVVVLPAAEPAPAPCVGESPAQPAEAPAEPAATAPAEPSWLEVEIYCVKCRDRRTVRNPETVVLANGRPAYQGLCPACGTKVTRILKAG